jgi:hypothetical protein
MSSIQLAYLLMIAGALLVAVGVVGLALRESQDDEADPVVLPEDAPWRNLLSDSPSEPYPEPKKKSERSSTPSRWPQKHSSDPDDCNFNG